jgi:uncharacterized RDD family membrane protein YckC
MLTDLPRAQASARGQRALTRRERLLAALRDALALLPPLMIASALAVGWLLARTAWGRDDASDFDSSVALALVCAAPAAWLARLGYSMWTYAATPGQRAQGLRVEVPGEEARDPAGPRALRLALHPFASAGWGVVTMTLLLAGAWQVAAVMGALALLVMVGGVASLAIVIARPDARAVHDRIAGTRVVRA